MGFLIAFISFCCLFFSVQAALRLTGGKFVLTPGNIYLTLYFLFHFPLILMIDSSVIEYALVVNLGVVGFVVGMYLAMHGTKPAAMREYQITRPTILSPSHNAVVLIAFGLLITLLFYKGPPPTFSILFNALQGKNVFNELLGMSGFRADLTKSHYFGGSYTGQGALKIFNEMAWQLIVVFMYVRALQIRSRAAWYQFAAVGLLAFLIVYGVGAKGPVAYIAIAALVARSFMTNIPYKRLVKYTAILFSFLIIIQFLQVSRFANAGDGNMFVAVVETLARRITAGNGLNTYFIVDLIANGRLDHYNGYDHLTKFLNALPGIQFDVPFAHDLFWMITEDKAPDKTTYATYTYLGGSYLDFGYAGAFLNSVIAGLIIQFMYRLMLKMQRSTFTIAISATFSIHLGQVVAGSLVSLPSTLFVVCVLYGVVAFSNALLGRSTRYVQQQQRYQAA